MRPGKAITGALVRGVGFILLAMLAATVARADNYSILNDPLDNWNVVAWHSQGLTFDTSNPQWFDSDTSRVKRTEDGQEGFYYHTPGAVRVVCIIYYFEQLGETDLYGSSDGQSWTPITSHFWPKTSGPGWNSGMLEAKNFGSDCNYIGIRIISGSQVYSPQIGSVQIIYDPNSIGPATAPTLPIVTSPVVQPLDTPKPDTPPAPARPVQRSDVPGGLTVMAAGGLASVDWLSVPGASKYRLSRGPEPTSFHVIAADITGTHVRDQGLKPGVAYYYVLTALKADGSVATSEDVRVVPDHDGVVFDDPLTDWSLCADHTDNLELAKGYDGEPCVRRTKTTPESVEYNLPGAERLAVTVSYQGDLTSQFTVDASPDGAEWASVPVTNSTPVPTGTNTFVAVCTTKGALPSNTNFLRINLAGDTATNSPAISNIRLTYGLLPRATGN
ncbi:MAG: hypothetical protein ACLQVD_18795 [Capsulimonadaceae bacterium]